MQGESASCTNAHSCPPPPGGWTDLQCGPAAIRPATAMYLLGMAVPTRGIPARAPPPGVPPIETPEFHRKNESTQTGLQAIPPALLPFMRTPMSSADTTTNFQFFLVLFQSPAGGDKTYGSRRCSWRTLNLSLLVTTKLPMPL